MKSSSAVIISIVVTTLSVSPLALQGCGSSSTPGVSASGGATTSSLGGSGYLGAGGSAFTGAGGSGTFNHRWREQRPCKPKLRRQWNLRGHRNLHERLSKQSDPFVYLHLQQWRLPM